MNTTLRIGVLFLAAVLFSKLEASPDGDPLAGLRDAQIEKGYRDLLSAMPVQLESGGSKTFELPDGSIWFVSVGLTIAKPESPMELLRRKKVALAKARAAAVEELNGTRVSVTRMMTTDDKVVIEDGREEGSSEETLSEEIVTTARGKIRGLPVVATWMSADGSFYFTAIGARLK